MTIRSNHQIIEKFIIDNKILNFSKYGTKIIMLINLYSYIMTQLCKTNNYINDLKFSQVKVFLYK